MTGGCDNIEMSVVLPLGIIRIDEKMARYGPFFAENQFSPADEFVLVGLVVRKCHFDVTACAEEPFVPMGPAGALRAPAGQDIILISYLMNKKVVRF